MTETGFTLDLGDPLRAGVFFVTADDLATLDDTVRDAGLLARQVDLRGCADKPTLLALLDEASAEWAEHEIPFWAFLALPEEEFEDADD